MAVTMQKLKEFWMIIALFIGFFTWIVTTLNSFGVTLAVLETKIDYLSYRIEQLEGGPKNGTRR